MTWCVRSRRLIAHLFELKHSAQCFHHGVFLVVFHQVCQGVKLLPSTNIILHIMLTKKKKKTEINPFTYSQIEISSSKQSK